jgi:hypothetical protein
MANIFNSTDQYRFTGKGPLDAKALVPNFKTLTKVDTWIASVTNPNTGVVTNVRIDYNGMIVAVWNDPDATKNGVYFLHDSQVKTALAKPNIEDEANWHKMGGLGGLPGLEAQIAELKDRVGTVEDTVSGLQQTTSTLSTAVETLRADVDTLQAQAPTFDVIKGGTANN